MMIIILIISGGAVLYDKAGQKPGAPSHPVGSTEVGLFDDWAYMSLFSTQEQRPEDSTAPMQQHA